MKKVFLYILQLLIPASVSLQAQSIDDKPHKIAIAIHGGASNIRNMNLSAEQDTAYRTALSEAIEIGYAVLKNGGSSLDAVTASVKYMEDNPLFNAGKGSVFAADSTNEMDAAIMNGANLKCGAVAGVGTIKNPILAARKILDSSQYIMLSGAGAEKFAAKYNLEIVSPDYFKTDFRWNQFLHVKDSDSTHLDNDVKEHINPVDETKIEKFGTVGCVAIDNKGNLAAATSTGGIVNKNYNRIGDSPIIGAGTYANNNSCAVSCTGKGEDFIRIVAAKDISCLIEYQRKSLKRAVEEVIQKKLKSIKGRGGCIAIDKKGNIITSFTTSGMFRASIDKEGKRTVAIYDNE
jgi:beta-aspartyl-peptidase (threonine type)